ncbi:GNAT family N-acetyltransferase [Halobaculum rarum]|uniref:GNAT family N-acetyltransferase n=1 Tax=Halobaculum rarum TaxID=3075122 RepID=UPI0032AEE0E1
MTGGLGTRAKPNATVPIDRMPVDPSDADPRDRFRLDSGGTGSGESGTGENGPSESGGDGVTLERGTMDDVDAVVDLWVALAEGQRSYGTHLVAAENRPDAADAVSRAVVTDGLVVARAPDPESTDSEPGDSDATDPDAADATTGSSGSEAPTIVGFVTFGVESGRYDLDVTRGVVYNLFVRERHRGAGVGSRLLATAESALADAGVDVVALEAMADNEDARRFYQRHGYHPHRVELEKPVQGDRSDSD